MWRLAWRYIWCYRGRSAVLVAAVTLAAYLPLATNLLLERVQHDLRHRSDTPALLVGAKGSRTDLTLHALYFSGRSTGVITYSVVDESEEGGFAFAIPLIAHHTVRRTPLVGTTLDYFDFRQMTISKGRMIGRIGECVVGWRVAQRLRLKPGDHVLTDTESFVDLTRYPLRMRVVGVLNPTDSSDDEAFFCDLKTTWVIDGIGHGHQEVAELSEPGVILKRNDKEVIAGAALQKYTEITAENESSFHFHGDRDHFPITAALVVPKDDRAATILIGRWQKSKRTTQLVEPKAVIEELLVRVFQVKGLLDVAAALVAVTTILLIGLVTMLSLRLRASEMRTLFKLGCRRSTTIRLFVAELSLIAAGCSLLLTVFIAITIWVGPSVLRWWLISGA